MVIALRYQSISKILELQCMVWRRKIAENIAVRFTRNASRGMRQWRVSRSQVLSLLDGVQWTDDPAHLDRLIAVAHLDDVKQPCYHRIVFVAEGADKASSGEITIISVQPRRTG